MLSIGNKTPAIITIGGKDVASIAIAGETVWNKQALIESPLRIDKKTDVGTRTVSLTKNGNAPEINLEYSFDNSTWQTWTPDSNGKRTMSLPADTSMFIRGNNPNGLASTDNDFYSFSCDKTYDIAGDICSLVSHYEVDTLPDYCFRGLFKNSTTLCAADSLRIESTNLGASGMNSMFYGCKSLTTAPDLSNITTVDDYGMHYMFYGCTSLTTAPDFSNVTTVGDSGMYYMFYGCKSLKTAPDLSNVTTVSNKGMQSMFRACTSLKTAPDFSSITTVGTYGMGFMFYGCTSLTTGPDFSNVTTVSNSGMNWMFNGCTSLTTAPDLSNVTTVDDYGMQSMFYGCTSLTTGPDLSNVTTLGDEGMRYMFYLCTSLTTVYAPTITWNTSKTSNWLLNVAAKGTLYADSSIASRIPTSSVNGCPSGWTVVSQ